MSVQEVLQSELPIEEVDWRGLHRNYLNAGEMAIIAALVRGIAARSMVEIGCRDGRTARVMLDNVATLQSYIGVDVPMDYQPGLPSQRSEMVADPGHYAAGDERFRLIIRPRGSLDLKPADICDCDAVFIDGDHSEQVVLHDSDLALAAVRAGGLVIWHDYTSRHLDDVTRVLDGLASGGLSIKHVVGTWLAFCQVP
jgi:predicted O-methyltransferase YrrM